MIAPEKTTPRGKIHFKTVSVSTKGWMHLWIPKIIPKIVPKTVPLSLVLLGTLVSCLGGSYGAAPTCSSRQNNTNSALACATDATTLEIHQGETLRLNITLPSSVPINAPLYWDKMDALSQKDATSNLIASIDGSIHIKSTANPFKNDSQNPIELVVSADSRAALGKHSGQNFNITRMDNSTKLSLGWFYITVLPKTTARGDERNQKTCHFFVFCLL
jgi:hypothetical protein